MLAQPGDEVNTTLILDSNLTATNSFISFIEANNIRIASQTFFGVGFPILKGSSSPAGCRWSFLPANSNSSVFYGISDFTSDFSFTRVNFSQARPPATSTEKSQAKTTYLMFPRSLILRRPLL